MSSNILGTKDANLPLGSANAAEGKDVKSMEYHRQVLQSKMEEEKYEHFKSSIIPTTKTPRSTTASLPSSSSTPRKSPSIPSLPQEDKDAENNYILSSPAHPVIMSIPGRARKDGSSNNTTATNSNNNKLNSRADIVLLRESQKQQYISPSDNIMSPCTAKLTALRSKHAGKAKPKSLFAQTSSKRLEGDALFGSKSTTSSATKEPEN